MVNSKTILIIACMFLLCTLSFAENKLEVQDPSGHPKISSNIKVSQKFKTLKQCQIQVGGYSIKLDKGTIGIRTSEYEWFIAKGAMFIEGYQNQLGRDDHPIREPELTIRHGYGVLRSRGEDYLFINLKDNIRWYPLSKKRESSFEYRRKKINITDGQLFIGFRNQTFLLEKPKQAFSLNEVQNSSRQTLLLKSKLVGTSNIASSGRNKSKQDFIRFSSIEHERNHARSQARRNFSY